MLINALAGLAAADRMLQDLMRSYGAGYWRHCSKLRLPVALPFLFNAFQDQFDPGADRRHRPEFFGSPTAGLGFRISVEMGRMNGCRLGDHRGCRLAGSLSYGYWRCSSDRSPFGIRLRGDHRFSKRERRDHEKNGASDWRVFCWSPVAIFGGSRARQADAPTEVGHPGAVRRVLRRQSQGLHDEVGLDVTIKAGGPDINPSQVIAGGGADVVLDWMPSAMATREKGVPLVNIAQVFQASGMMLTCRKDSGVATPADFPARPLGVWFGGNEYPFLNWMNKLGYKTDGSAGGVEVLKQGFQRRPAAAEAGGLHLDHDL